MSPGPEGDAPKMANNALAACLDVEGLFTVTVRHDVAAYHQHAAVAIL